MTYFCLSMLKISDFVLEWLPLLYLAEGSMTKQAQRLQVSLLPQDGLSFRW